jgi:small-conductance mechanosensitive channel
MRISFVTRFLLLAALVWVVLFGFQMMPSEMLPHPSQTVSDQLLRQLNTPYFNIGDLAVTPAFLLKAIAFLVLLSIFTGLVRRFLRERVLVHTSMDEGQRYAFARVTGYAIFLVGVLIGLNTTGVDLNSLLVVGGAVGIGVALGLQAIANNFISGLVLLIERPIKVGDRVEVGDVNGDVVRIAGRSTWVRTNDNVVIIVPNSEFVTGRVTNWTANDRSIRFALPVGVSYESNPDEVRRVLLDVAAKHPDVLVDPKPDVLFKGFGDSALHFELRVWTIRHVQTPKNLMSDLNFAIFEEFRKHGIHIPFPQRDLHLRSAKVPITIEQAG